MGVRCFKLFFLLIARFCLSFVLFIIVFCSCSSIFIVWRVGRDCIFCGDVVFIRCRRISRVIYCSAFCSIYIFGLLILFCGSSCWSWWRSSGGSR